MIPHMFLDNCMSDTEHIHLPVYPSSLCSSHTGRDTLHLQGEDDDQATIIAV